MNARLEVIGIVVADMARALAFYRHLGFDLPPEADKESHVEATLPGGLRIAWDTVETVTSFDPDWSPPKGGPRMGLAFRLDGSADVDSAYADLVALGYDAHKAPWDAFWGMRYAVIHDPDGNSIDLFADLNA